MTKLNRIQINILLSLGQNPDEAINLDYIDYNESKFTRIELKNYISELEKNDLVERNWYKNSLISLTEKGIDYAFELRQKTPNKQLNKDATKVAPIS